MIFASAEEPDSKQKYKQAEGPVIDGHADARMAPALFDKRAAETVDTVVHRIEFQRVLNRVGHGIDILHNGYLICLL